MLTSNETLQLRKQLSDLGMESGQAVLVRAAAKSMGLEGRNPAESLIDAITDAIGPTGTVLALSHSPIFPAWSKPRDYVYDPATAPVLTGGFAAALCSRARSMRSRHPTESMVGLGPAADRLLSSHDQTEAAFEPIRRLAEVGGRMLLVGCTVSSPGFSSVHLAQESLGLSRQSLMSGLLGAPFRSRDGHIVWYARRDHAGCSRGFGRFYDKYRERGDLLEGAVGEAPSMSILASKAFEIDLDELSRDPTSSQCNESGCWDCAARLYSARRWPKFIRSRLQRFL